VKSYERFRRERAKRRRERRGKFDEAGKVVSSIRADSAASPALASKQQTSSLAFGDEKDRKRARKERNCLFSDVKERKGNENERREEMGYLYSLASVRSEWGKIEDEGGREVGEMEEPACSSVRIELSPLVTAGVPVVV
jgi:hypothetical protein